METLTSIRVALMVWIDHIITMVLFFFLKCTHSGIKRKRWFWLNWWLVNECNRLKINNYTHQTFFSFHFQHFQQLVKKNSLKAYCVHLLYDNSLTALIWIKEVPICESSKMRTSLLLAWTFISFNICRNSYHLPFVYEFWQYLHHPMQYWAWFDII